MPDKTTQHIEKAARDWYDSLCQWVNAGADREAATIRAFEAILKTTLEPSEAEISAYFEAYESTIRLQPMWNAIRAGLIAAARVRVGE